MRLIRFLMSVLLIPALIWGGAAHAATSLQTNFTVQITILDACSIISATNMDFGVIGVISAPGISATSTITVACSLLTPFNIGLNAGTGAGATVANRLMTGPAPANGGTAQTVSYSLYRDITRLLVWGNTIGTNTQAGLGIGTNQPFTVYGYVPMQTTPESDTYIDTITVTLTY